MRKNVKNDKVLRAISIGLATMIAVTSTPVSVFADATDAANGEPATEGEDNKPADSQDNNENAGGNQQQQQQQDPQKVDAENATAGLQQAADLIKEQTETKEGTEEVVGGIEAAKGAANTIIVLQGGGDPIVVTKQNADGTSEDISAQSIEQGLEAAEAVLLNSKVDGKDVGVYNDITQLQTAINEFYTQNKALTDMVDDLVGNDDQGNMFFYGDAEKKTRYEVVPVTVDGTTQFLVIRSDSKGDLTLANVNTAFDKTENSGDNSKSESENAAAAKAAAQNANSTSNEQKAREFKASANTFIEQAEGDFKVDSDKIDEVAQFVEDTQEKIKKIKEQANTVQEKLKEIKDLKAQAGGEGGNATALDQQLHDLEQQAAALEQAAEKARVEALGGQVRYDLLLQIQNVDNSAREIAEANLANGKDVTAGDYWKEGRKLCNLLLQYYLLNGDLTIVGKDGKAISKDSLTVLDKDGNPVDSTKSGIIMVGAEDFDIDDVVYYVPDETQTLYDENGVPYHPLIEVTDDYDITSEQRSKMEFLTKDELGNITEMAKKITDGTGFIFANKWADNRVVVNIKDSEGNIIGTAYYNCKANTSDGSLYIFERSYDINDEYHAEKAGQKYEAEVPEVTEVQESWSTADGKKVILADHETHELQKTSTTHTINISDNASDGFYAIDTASSKDVSTAEDIAVGEPTTQINGNTTTTYAAVAGTEETRYEKGTYTVVDSYYKETKNEKANAKDSDSLKELVNGYKEKGQNVKVEVGFLGADDIYIFGHKVVDLTYEVNPNELNWFDKLNAEVPWSGGYKLNISYEVDDLSKPKDTHQEAGIYEIVTKNYVETTTVSESHNKKSGDYGHFIKKWPFWDDGKDAATAAMNAELARLNGLNSDTVKVNITSYDVTTYGIDVAKLNYHYYINYTIETITSTQTVPKEISRKQYAADTYTNHTDYVAPVEHNDEVPEIIGYSSYTTKNLVWKTDGQSKQAALDSGSLNKNKDTNLITNGANGGYQAALENLKTENGKVAQYTDLKNKTASAASAADTFLELLRNFTYPTVPVAVSDLEGGEGQIADVKPVNEVYGFTADTFEDYIWGEEGLINVLNAPLTNIINLLEAAKERRDALGREIADARAAVNAIDLSRFDDDDDDYVDEDVVPGTPGDYSGLPGSSADVITLTPVGGFDDEGTAGGRGGRRGGDGAQDRGVAGVRVEDNNGTNKNTNPVAIKNTNDDDKDNGAKNLTKVETPEKPLAATPFKEDPVNPAIVGISIAALLAVLAGLYYEYNRRKKAKADEMKKYKKN